MQYPLYVIGKRYDDTSGYLRRLFLQHILKGKGGAYFDFSGEMHDLLSSIPQKRITDTVLFFPTDREYPVGFNPLHKAEDKARTATAVVDAFKSVWHYDAATPLLDLYLYTTVAALLDMPQASLLGMAQMLTDASYRAAVIAHIGDPVLKSFWRDFYETLPEKEQKQTTMSTLNKVYELIVDPTVRNIIGQKKTTFTVFDTTVLIASFPQELGLEKGSFLATLLLSSLPDDFLVILDQGDRIGYSAVIDAIKRRPLAFGHQFGAQLSQSLRETLIGTAQTLVAFRIGPTDAKRLTPEFYLKPQGNYPLVELPPETYHLRTAYETKADQVLLPLSFSTYDARKAIDVCRTRYGVPRAHVESMMAVTDDTSKTRAKLRKPRRK